MYPWTIDNVLNTSPTLVKVLDIGDVISETRCNRELETYLGREDVLRQLISYTLTPFSDEDEFHSKTVFGTVFSTEDLPKEYKYPFLAAELLSMDITPIVEELHQNRNMLSALFEFLNLPVLSPWLALRLTECVHRVFVRSPTGLIEFLKEENDVRKVPIVKRLVQNIERQPLGDLLGAIVGGLGQEDFDDYSDWWLRKGFLDLIFDLLQPDKSDDTIIAGCRFLLDFLRRCNVPRLMPYVDRLVRPQLTTRLIKLMLAGQAADPQSTIFAEGAVFLAILADRILHILFLQFRRVEGGAYQTKDVTFLDLADAPPPDNAEATGSSADAQTPQTSSQGPEEAQPAGADDDDDSNSNNNTKQTRVSKEYSELAEAELHAGLSPVSPAPEGAEARGGAEGTAGGGEEGEDCSFWWGGALPPCGTVQDCMQPVYDALPAFTAILRDPGALEPVEVTWQDSPFLPLGAARLRIAELAATLAKLDDQQSFDALQSSGIVGVLLDLCVEFDMNNMLHSAVDEIVTASLPENRAPPKPEEDGRPAAPSAELSTLFLHLVVDCNLLGRIVECDEANTARIAAGLHSRGCMGFITQIAEELILVLERPQAAGLEPFVQKVPGWKEYTAALKEKLSVMHAPPHWEESAEQELQRLQERQVPLVEPLPCHEADPGDGEPSNPEDKYKMSTGGTMSALSRYHTSVADEQERQENMGNDDGLVSLLWPGGEDGMFGSDLTDASDFEGAEREWTATSAGCKDPKFSSLDVEEDESSMPSLLPPAVSPAPTVTLPALSGPHGEEKEFNTFSFWKLDLDDLDSDLSEG